MIPARNDPEGDGTPQAVQDRKRGATMFLQNSKARRRAQ
jgi:hypothetical protein